VPIAANAAEDRRDSTSFLHQINSLLRGYRLRRKSQRKPRSEALMHVLDECERCGRKGLTRRFFPNKICAWEGADISRGSIKKPPLIDRAIRPHVVASERRNAMAFFSPWRRGDPGITYGESSVDGDLF
jgi:hypothetical protein